jgi:hypothetical protein
MNGTMMKLSIGFALAMGTAALAACNNNSAQEQSADDIEANAEATADNLEQAAGEAANDATHDALQNQADATREAGEAAADANRTGADLDGNSAGNRQ